MKRYRFAALALVTCAAGLSLAACSAGVTEATPAASSPAVSKTTRSPAPSPTASPSVTGGTVSLGGSIGGFPIPPAAKVLESTTENRQITVLLSSVTPAQVSRFYVSALPRAGYKITSNTSAAINNITEVSFMFTGHRYKGEIDAVTSTSATTGANPSSPSSPSGPSVPSVPSVKNLTSITFTPQ